MRRKQTRDLRCGDVFLFREVEYVCLVNFAQFNTLQSIVTAVLASESGSEVQTIYSIRFFSNFVVEVRDVHISLKLKSLEHTIGELDELDHPERYWHSDDLMKARVQTETVEE